MTMPDSSPVERLKAAIEAKLRIRTPEAQISIAWNDALDAVLALPEWAGLGDQLVTAADQVAAQPAETSFRPCSTCGASMVMHGPLPCPDGKPGCLVGHFSAPYCPTCQPRAAQPPAEDDRARLLGVRLIEQRITQHKAVLEGWREPDGHLVATEPDPQERQAIRSTLGAAVHELSWALGALPPAAKEGRWPALRVLVAAWRARADEHDRDGERGRKHEVNVCADELDALLRAEGTDPKA